MANALYDLGRQAYLEGSFNWLTDSIKACLVNTSSYTVNLATHQYLSDISSGAIVASSSAFTGKTSTSGAADANDITFSAVSGATVGAIVLYKDTGTASTSQLIAYIDTATGLPITPNGGDIIVTWDNGANRIFKL